ncbi:MAG: type 1 glutamine amidotransferase [Nocardia sp.]|nr:type 1 glutamine amidotransferase [Nocardia sp.]
MSATETTGHDVRGAADTSAIVLVITSNTGVERDELLVPPARLRERGLTVVHAAPDRGPVQTFEHDTEKSVVVDADLALTQVEVDDFDAVVVPGGTVNADKLRRDPNAIALVGAFAAAGKPVAAICHGPWLLIEAGLVDGQALTSYPSLRTDLVNAGGRWTDQPVVESAAGGRTVITSRNPGDLEPFTSAVAGAALAVTVVR